MGTAEFAVPSLRVLAALHDVVACLTKEDAPSRRGRESHPTPVKVAATELGIPVLTPRTLRDADVQDQLRALNADVFVVAAYGLILPQEVLDIPTAGCVNVHGSLLPKWRGAAPVERAILAGDATTGACLMLMEAGLDTGPTCACEATPIGEKYRDELTAEVAEIGAALLGTHVGSIVSGAVTWTPQDDGLATYAHKIRKEELVLTPALTADEALLRVRASSEHAPASLALAGVRMTVLRAETSTELCQPGQFALAAGQLVAGFQDGSLVLDTIRPAGKRAMPGRDWVRGARITEGATWE